MISKFSLTIVMLLSLEFVIAAQEKEKHLVKRWEQFDTPLNCETTLRKFDDLRDLIKADKNKTGVLILIARLGNGEKLRNLNLRRLRNVRDSLKVTFGVEKDVVIAEGERIKGFGRVEFYLGGELVGALLAHKNKYKIICDF